MNQWVIDDDLRHAQWERDTYSIPEYAYQAYRSQRHVAKRRGIEFLFTLLGWHLWWKTELAKIGPEAKRGLRKGEYMMCRKGDIGPYSPDNVFIGTAKDNHMDRRSTISQSDFMKKWHAEHDCHLKGKVGDDHPKSKAVITPEGRFPSISAASTQAGITRQGGLARVRRGEWQYE